MGRFEGHTVLVTGATGGMGASHVRAYHREGAHVVVAASREERAQALVDDLGERATAVRLDVTDADAWVAAVETVEQRVGPIAVLVNNAGIQHPPATLEHIDRATWDHVLAVNTTGSWLGIRAVAPSMRAGGGGVIVNVASVMAHGGTPMFGPYVASKWAVRGLTATAALELARDGIRVNSIHPGVVATPLITEPSATGGPAIADSFSPASFAVPRLADPAEVSAMLLWLTSPEAAFATGAEFVLDGGLLLGPALPADPAAA